jgi:hypothetical protein
MTLPAKPFNEAACRSATGSASGQTATAAS